VQLLKEIAGSAPPSNFDTSINKTLGKNTKIMSDVPHEAESGDHGAQTGRESIGLESFASSTNSGANSPLLLDRETTPLLWGGVLSRASSLGKLLFYS
jgi:hypothetical protein